MGERLNDWLHKIREGFLIFTLPLFSYLQLTRISLWNKTVSAEELSIVFSCWMVEWFLVLQKRKKFLVFSIEVTPQLKTLLLTVRSAQVGVLILFVLCIPYLLQYSNHKWYSFDFYYKRSAAQLTRFIYITCHCVMLCDSTTFVRNNDNNTKFGKFPRNLQLLKVDSYLKHSCFISS